MTRTPPHRDQLAQAVRSRRTTGLRLSAEQIRAAGGPSGTVLSRIENAHPGDIDWQTYARLDEALGWEPGTAQRIDTQGGQPVEAGRVTTLTQPAPPAAAGRFTSAELRLPDGSIVVVASSAPLTKARADALHDEIVRRTAS